MQSVIFCPVHGPVHMSNWIRPVWTFLETTWKYFSEKRGDFISRFPWVSYQAKSLHQLLWDSWDQVGSYLHLTEQARLFQKYIFEYLIFIHLIDLCIQKCFCQKNYWNCLPLLSRRLDTHQFLQRHFQIRWLNSMTSLYHIYRILLKL